MLKRRKERGDTLIEVLVAFGVFSLAVVGAMAVMNQGSFLAQRSVETTLVRQEVNSQAEALRFLHDSYVATYQPGEVYNPSAPNSPTKQWLAMQDQIIKTGATTATDISQIGNTCPTPPTGSFVMDSRNGQYVDQTSGRLVPATGYAQLTYTVGSGDPVFNQSQGIWIEAIRSAPSTEQYQSHIGFTDFYILACWPGIGQDKATTLGTIVRLYEPR